MRTSGECPHGSAASPTFRTSVWVPWVRVGGSLGTPVALAAGGIALLAVLLVGFDLRRQVLLGADPEDDGPAG